MLITRDTLPESLGERGLRWWRGDRFSIGWKGHFYLDGCRAGPETAARLADGLAERPLTALAGGLRGVFGLFVHDRRTGEWRIAVDNTGLYKVFHDRLGAGTSLMELLRARPWPPVPAAQALMAFLQHGFVAAPDTFVEGVAKLAYDEVLELGPMQPPRLAPKQLAFPEDDETILPDHFASLAHSLVGRRLSVDVTGGFDSRLIAAVLAQHGLDFETAITGQPMAADVQLAARVALALGRPFHPHFHRIDRLEQELPLVFAAGDGQHEIRGFHRDWQNAQARLGRGVEVMAHGIGGETFKDFNAVQDFPFYGRRRPNLARFYDLRIAPLRLPPAVLGRTGRALAGEVRTSLLARCAAFEGRTAAEIYDRIYVLLRTAEFAGRYFTNYINMGLDVVAPYLDHRAARVAWRMSPWRRWMNGWHRRTISACRPDLAALPTTDGYSARAGLASLPAVGAAFVAQGLRRVSRKASQRLLGRTLFEKRGINEYNAAGYVAELRRTAAFAQACRALVAEDILAGEADPAEIPDFFVPRVLTLGMFLAEIAQRPASTSVAAAAAGMHRSDRSYGAVERESSRVSGR